jgi:atlastin
MYLDQYKSVNTLNGPDNSPKSEVWIGEPDEPLKGFSWKSGVERHTSGIVFWSDAFLHTTEDGEELAIILIDTQGLFDHDTPPAINSKIFTFTTLMSSYQIFNLPQLLQENHLEYLQVFLINLFRKCKYINKN